MNLYLAGVLGGLVGGVVFGVMMGMMGMLSMVAKLWRGESAKFGMFVHLVNSAIIGLLYVLVLPWLGVAGLENLSSGALTGLVYGFGWWVLGPLLVMPVWLGMPPQLSFEGIKKALPSLVGHAVYGVLLGLVVAWLL